jgi:hypothetical protein
MNMPSQRAAPVKQNQAAFPIFSLAPLDVLGEVAAADVQAALDATRRLAGPEAAPRAVRRGGRGRGHLDGQEECPGPHDLPEERTEKHRGTAGEDMAPRCVREEGRIASPVYPISRIVQRAFFGPQGPSCDFFRHGPGPRGASPDRLRHRPRAEGPNAQTWRVGGQARDRRRKLCIFRMLRAVRHSATPVAVSSRWRTGPPLLGLFGGQRTGGQRSWRPGNVLPERPTPNGANTALKIGCACARS